MCLNIQISDAAAQELRAIFGDDLDRAALEALVIEGYRSRKFGLAKVRELLGLKDRWETEQWLGARGIIWNYDASELDADRETLDRLFGRVA